MVIDSAACRGARALIARSGMISWKQRAYRAYGRPASGRAGRVASGVCYRLEEEAERALDPHSAPEIAEADLSTLVLELAAWGIAEPTQLRWLTPPPSAACAQARELLTALGALDARGQITAHGRAMTELGTHPRLAHMLLRARDRDLEKYGLGALACDVAAMLGERDLLRLPPEARNVDMRLRVEALRGIRDHLPAGAVVDRGVRERASQQAASWRQKLAATSDTSVDDVANDGAGILLALAYPDRIARLRSGQPGRYQLSNGRGATLADTDALARSEFLAIAEIDAGDRDAKIFLAAPLRRETLESLYASQIQNAERVFWDNRSDAVVARSERRLGQLIIEESPLDRSDPQLTAAAMVEGIRAMGIAALPWDATLRNWQQRVLFLRKHAAATASWPDVSDANLELTLEQWLAPFLSGMTRREHLQKLDLRAALLSLLSYAQQRELDAQAPTHIEVPSGSRIALDYGNDGAVVLAARLQELFGMQSTPRIAYNRVAVLIHLLSPARRPVQVTTDLANFWKHGYQEVRRELKGRYPKHYWPEDPFTAVATHRVRPR
ncbi:MAG: ATP-dependent helicase C-terminal domain-containing protein [Gammaproteobacteria bacterium]